MNMDEKDANKDNEYNNIEKELLQDAEGVQIPERLKPENIEKLLNTKKVKKSFGMENILRDYGGSSLLCVGNRCCFMESGWWRS